MVFLLDFVPGGINSENFMVSCFPLIYRTVWASVTMVTKQNRYSTRHSHSSYPAVLIVVSHQIITFVFKSKWLISHLSTTGYDRQWNTSMKNRECFEKLIWQVKLLNKAANYLVKTLSAGHVRSFRTQQCLSIFAGGNLGQFYVFQIKDLWKYKFLKQYNVSHFPLELTTVLCKVMLFPI